MHSLYVASVWLHLVAAMTWIGGMIFLVAVIVPTLRRPAMRDQAGALLSVLGVRFRTVGWIAILTLVVTGVFNVLHRGYRFEHFFTGEVFSGAWGRTLAHKLSLVGVILVVSVVHDFWLGPKATRLAREGAPPEEREKYRRLASIFGRTSFGLALAVVALAVTLVR